MKPTGLKILVGICCLLPFNDLKAQNSGTKPQYWNNITLAWQVNDRLWVVNTLSYNFLFDKELPWSEFTYNGTAVFRMNSFLLANGGLYIATTKQSATLSSLEIRPYVGIRISTKANKRWLISNLTRIEWRNLNYSDDSSDEAFRLRNRTSAAIAINRKLILEDHTLSFFSYFEAFHNFDNEVVERYFTTLKYKAGLAYRFSPQWQINIGVLSNRTRSTIGVPSHAPTNVVSNFILELGVIYGIRNNG